MMSPLKRRRSGPSSTSQLQSSSAHGYGAILALNLEKRRRRIPANDIPKIGDTIVAATVRVIAPTTWTMLAMCFLIRRSGSLRPASLPVH